jgi:membrane protein
MSGKRLLQMVLLCIRQFRNPYYQGFAAQLAFYFVLSLIPLLIILSQILGVFSISLTFLDALINLYVSDDVTEILMDFINYKPTGATNVALFIIAAWSASKVQFCMIRIANYTMTDGQSTGKGFFRDRIKATLTMLFTLFTIVFALVILVYGELLFKLFLYMVPWSLMAEYEISKAMIYLRWPAALLLYFLMVTFNYYVLPYKKMKVREVLPGSLFASVSMLVVTVSYYGFMRYAANFDILYGSLSSAVALMFWFLFLSWALGLGVLFNKAWSDTKRADK